MHRRVRALVALSMLLAVTSCDVALQSFFVPTQAVAGAVFEVHVLVNFSGSLGVASGVLQLPNGFTVVGHASSTTEPVAIDPAPTTIYAAEPGTHLVGFSGGGAPSFTGDGTIQVFVQTAPGLTGTFTLKVALGVANGTTWVAQDPAQTQFALINDAAHTKSITLVPGATGEFAFDSVGLPITGGTTVRSWFSSSCGDLDGDGNDDIVALDTSIGLRHFQSQPRALQPVAGTSWTEQPLVLPLALPPGAPAVRCAIADLDRDGAADVMCGDGTPIFRNGTGWIVGAAPPLRQPGMDSVAIGDIDHDGLPDIALGGHANRALQVLLNNGNRTFRDSSTGLPNIVGQPTSRDTVLLADFDRDGNLDLFWSTTNGYVAFRGDGHGGWIPTTVPGSAFDGDAVAIDIDGDGVLEVVTLRGLVFRYFANNQFAQISGTGLEGMATAIWIEALDFDRDGDMDLAVVQAISGLEIWRNDGLGRFARYQAIGLPDTMVPGIVDLGVGDIDGNGWPDLLVTVDGTGVFAFQNLNTGVAPFGRGCSGVGVQTPTLAAIGSPTRGNAAFALRLHAGTGSVPGGLWFDSDRTHFGAATLPLDLAQFGASSCALLVPPTFLQLGLLDAAGNLTVPLPVPTTPALTRATFFAQGFVHAPGANAAGLVFTGGVAMRID